MPCVFRYFINKISNLLLRQMFVMCVSTNAYKLCNYYFYYRDNIYLHELITALYKKIKYHMYIVYNDSIIYILQSRILIKVNCSR